MNNKYIKDTALNLKLEISDSMLEEIKREWDFFSDSLEIIRKINTKDVKPFYFPNLQYSNYLREDIPVKSDFDRDVIFKNNPNFENGYFVIEKDLENND